MTKTELMENYTAEQLAEMVIKLNSAMDSLKYSDSFLKSGLFDNPAVATCEAKINILQNNINNLEEENSRLQSKLYTYNNYLLPRCTKEAKEMIDHNHFTGVRIVTQEQWNNRKKADRKVYFPKEYEQAAREFLNIDTSEIQDDCHRFGIESLQRYLKNPAPIKITKRDDKNMSISDIQKCQEEYEKLLKEIPLHGTIDKICEDIIEQKNNAMAMEFTRIIGELLRKNGVYIRFNQIEIGEDIHHNIIERKYGITFDDVDFSQHDKEFTDKIEKLQSEVEKYRKAFEDAKNERDCQVAEYQNRTEKYKTELERARNTINQIDDILEKLFGVRHDVGKPDEFEKILFEKVKGNVADFLPTEPIKVADMLINANKKRKNCMTGKEYNKYIFEKWKLRQIAKHLIVYCNHNGEAEE